MNEELKTLIVTGAQEYATQKKLSNNDVAKLAGINAGYISNMFRLQFTTTVDGKSVPIGDKWFNRLSEWADLVIKKGYWQTFSTPQLMQIIPALETAKRLSKPSVLIGETGCGKTYTIDKFCVKNPRTYKITVSSVDRIHDILEELIDKLHVLMPPNRCALKLKAIINRIKELKHQGQSPMIIIDEAENLPLPVIKMLKGLYDGINGYGAIVLIGTSQLIHKLQRLKKNNREGMPQFYRRIKAGIRYIEEQKNFTPIFEKYVQDKGLRRLLTELCDNYGELNDYLEPALREADETEQPLTEELFRIMYNLPKYK